MGRCVIVGGADINNYSVIREKLCADDYVIFCDSGLKHLENLQVQPSSITDDYSFFSLLNITGCAKGITITGAKYPLVDGEISCKYRYGVSNEVLPGQIACVRVNEGQLLLIKDR